MALCPRPSLSDLPNLSLDIPAFMFGMTCLPGTATAVGCPADKAYYTIVIPWEKVQAEGWTAPGGNRYWQSSVPASQQDAQARSILALMAARSKTRFRDAFKRSDVRVEDILTKPTRETKVVKTAGGLRLIATTIPPGQWVTRFGIATVEVQPNPGETARAFSERGGYLFWVDPTSSPFLGKEALQTYGARPWMGDSVRTVGLWATYDVATQTIGYAIRIAMKSTWKQVVDNAEAWVRSNARSVCNKLATPEAVVAVNAASTIPSAQGYVLAYNAALQACGTAMAPATPCTPRPPESGLTVSPAGGPNVNDGSGIYTTFDPGPRMGAIKSEAALNAKYPLGTIARVFPAGPGSRAGYVFAVPRPGQGTTHVPVNEPPIPQLPLARIPVVTKTAWERAVLPWTHRTQTKLIGGGVAAAVAVGAGLFLRH